MDASGKRESEGSLVPVPAKRLRQDIVPVEQQGKALISTVFIRHGFLVIDGVLGPAANLGFVSSS